MSEEPRELDLINAVPAAVRKAGKNAEALVKEIAELPDSDPGSVAALRLWAVALPRLTEGDIATVAASVQLCHWWAQHTPDPALVFGRPVADQLRRAVGQLNLDQLEHSYTYWRELAASASTRVAELADDDDPEKAWEMVGVGEWTDIRKATFGPVLGAATNFTQYIHDRAVDQHLEAFEAAARTTERNFEVRFTNQVVMPDGGVVTTDDRIIPPPPPRRRRRWLRRNRSQPQ